MIIDTDVQVGQKFRLKRNFRKSLLDRIVEISHVYPNEIVAKIFDIRTMEFVYFFVDPDNLEKMDRTSENDALFIITECGQIRPMEEIGIINCSSPYLQRLIPNHDANWLEMNVGNSVRCASVIDKKEYWVSRIQ